MSPMYVELDSLVPLEILIAGRGVVVPNSERRLCGLGASEHPL